MAINLEKGQRINLEKESGGAKQFRIGLGWDARATDGTDFDLDACAAMLQENGKAASSSDIIYFNNLSSACGGLIHQGDNLTGDGDGDDEVINVDLSKVPESVQKIVFAAAIYKAGERSQNFGQVQNAFIRAVNLGNNEEVIRYDLSEDYSVNTAVTFGELYRHNGEWKFNATGEGHKMEVGELLNSFL
ncbi:TerD family protein [Oceanospirillum maris]|uniref:TerD family protein n=1 Tax=Oceanospirillum maris TaxID=64977 RepID=UPI000409F22E|nr:TerD family protein [Oceanospirillum maris]